MDLKNQVSTKMYYHEKIITRIHRQKPLLSMSLSVLKKIKKSFTLQLKKTFIREICRTGT